MRKLEMEINCNSAYTQNMVCSNFRFIFLTAFFSWVSVFSPMIVELKAVGTEMPDPMALDQERRIKEDTEQKAQEICDSILGKGQASVLANIELGIETNRKGGAALDQKRESKSGLGDENFILPWVPAPKSVSKEEQPKDSNVQTQAAQQESVDVRTVVKRFDITVIHDDTIPELKVTLVKDALTSAFDRYKSILKLFFKPTSFSKEGPIRTSDVVKKNFIDSLNLKTILFLILLMILFMVLKFFFGPLADFMKNYIDGMKEQSKSKVEMENKSEAENETDAANEDETLSEEEQQRLAEEQAAMEAALLAEEEVMEKFVPFKYITDENVKQLAYLLHHEEPWIVAMVISYLSAEHGYKVMEALPSDLQAKVALETAMYRQTSLEQVQAVDLDIKEKIDFVVGGLDKLVLILESSDRFARDNILEYLKNEKPAIYERVRENILLFEDIVSFPRPAMQVVVREVKTEQLGVALRGCSPELQQKFMENMSQGAAALLKEEMEFGRPVTDEQIEEERRKIVDLIKSMEKDGKLSFRQKGKGSSLEAMDMGSDMSGLRGMVGKSANPEAALASYQAGVQAGEAGDIEESIRQFEASIKQNSQLAPAHQALANAYYSVGRYQEALASYDMLLKLEPNDELQVWVDQLRATTSAAA
ncbi:MAG: FliG C-terminal domain-containing protein [Elusimicrobiota bacterium]